MNEEQLADVRLRFAEAGIPALAQVQILNLARERSRTERGVYRRVLEGIRRYHLGVQQELPWTRNPRRR